MAFKLPIRGLVFWPVGNGDSTTICIDAQTVLHVDLNHLECAEDSEDPREPIVDRLVKHLPKVAETPYLAAFALTHPDLDHCKGFQELHKKTHIGEIWFTPRVFKEAKSEFCDDAKAFKTEAMRRVKKTIESGLATKSGDRVRIIGYDEEVLADPEFKDFPEELITVPGNAVTSINGYEYAGTFKAFIHAPFKDDADGDRNDTSLGMQVSLFNKAASLRAMLLGDLSYPIVKRIFELSEDEDLSWNVFQAPHHCSKSVMHWADSMEDDETYRDEIMSRMAETKLAPSFIISSSMPVPNSNESGDNPPHAIAKERYLEVIEEHEFLCTLEHPNADEPEPIVFELGEEGIGHRKQSLAQTQPGTLGSAVVRARGSGEPPSTRVGFGKCL